MRIIYLVVIKGLFMPQHVVSLSYSCNFMLSDRTKVQFLSVRTSYIFVYTSGKK